MSLKGDLSTLDLAGLLQNLEAQAKSGLMSLEGPAGPTQLYFDGGKLSLLVYEGRPTLMDVLVASGEITAKDVETARKKRRRTKKSLGEVLVGAGALTEERLYEIAQTRLLDEACELVSGGAGLFTFTEGAIPSRVFDPEERRLQLKLPAGPLLMESARREDHWRLIRERIPSDSAHLIVQRRPRPTEETPDFMPALLDRLDGTRSVAEAMTPFPHQRFEAYQLLANLRESRAVREVTPAELAKLAAELGRHDRERAMVLLERGLATQPRNHNLLVVKAGLAESLGELEEAAEALKMLVHLNLESGEREKARARLDRLTKLAPADTAVWERRFNLALEEKRHEDAVREGHKLAELYRGPGLFRRACAVLEQIVELQPTWEHLRELARTRADAGDAAKAVQELERFGEEHLNKAEYPLALHVYEEILSLDPANKRAKDTVELIKTGEHERRRANRRRLIRRTVLVGFLALMGFCIYYEATARASFMEASRVIQREGLIEDGRYEEAIETLDAVRREYPLASASWLDARSTIAEWRAKSELRRKSD